MKGRSLFCALFVLMVTPAFSQSELFGLLTYKVPQSWQQQTRVGYLAYETYDATTQMGLQMAMYAPKPTAVKADSAFRSIWRAQFDSVWGNPSVPTVIKKRYTPAGVSYFEAAAQLKSKSGESSYKLLWVFFVGKQAQRMVVTTNSIAAYKSYAEVLREFLEQIGLSEAVK